MAYIGKSPTGSGVRQRYTFTATGGETSLSGTDDNAKTLQFSDGEYVDVYLNGVLLVQGTDYGVGTANTIDSLTALVANDVVEIITYDIYNIADANRKLTRFRYYKTAVGAETSISGTDDNGATITFPANAEIEVRLNGISLVQGVDFNTNTANTVGGLDALTAGQMVEIIYYKNYVLADTVSKAAGGTFGSSVGITGDLTVDTDTLHVDSTNDRVGIGTTSPSRKLSVDKGTGAGYIAEFKGTNTLSVFDSATDGIGIGSGAGDNLTLYAGDNFSSGITVDTSGNLGIGTTSPQRNIHVHEGDSTESSIKFTNSTTGSATGDGFTVGLNSDENGVLFLHENKDILFATNATERLRILSSGGITFNGDTATANALDDYEEGTWTPATTTSTSVTMGTNLGATYTKIGRMVNVQAYFAWSNTQNNNSNTFFISGLPFTVGHHYGTFTLGYVGSANMNDAVGVFNINSTQMYFHQNDGTSTALSNSDITSRAFTNFILNGTYYI